MAKGQNKKINLKPTFISDQQRGIVQIRFAERYEHRFRTYTEATQTSSNYCGPTQMISTR